MRQRLSRRNFFKIAGGAALAAAGASLAPRFIGQNWLAPTWNAGAQQAAPDLAFAATDGWIFLPPDPAMAPYHPDSLAPAPFTTYVFGFRNVITNKVVKTPEDLKGVKLRTPGSQLFIQTLTAMGATVTPLPWAETLPGVQQGIVDGIEGSEFTNIGTKVYELLKNVARTQHFLGTCGVYISTQVWEKIPEEYRAIVAEEFAKGALEMVEIGKRDLGDVTAKLESYGVKFNEVDKKAFTEATKSIYETFPGLTPGIYDKLQAELEKIRAK